MPSEMTDTIILHPNNDGTHHWMCPNCKREDLGLSAETDLTAYCPNVTCPNCGFQFGVDKRYLNGVSASYICGECLLMQRFNGTCGNCGANALRRASIPVPLAIPNTDKERTTRLSQEKPELQSQLEQLRAENERLKEDRQAWLVWANDLTGNQQHLPSKMRSQIASYRPDAVRLCLQKAAEWDSDDRYGRWYTAAQEIAAELEKL